MLYQRLDDDRRLLGALGVGLGAYAAHGLDEQLLNKYGDQTRTVLGKEIPAAEKYLTDFRTGVTYQMYHALGLIAVGILVQTRSSKSLQVAGWCFLAGILFFSGSLYIIALGGSKALGVSWGLVAMTGGISYIAGWVALAIGACPCGHIHAKAEPSTLPIN